MKRTAHTSMAEQADRHVLYQQSVQDVSAEIDFIWQTWKELRNHAARLLREDFCGTANTACEWVRRDPRHRAIGVDLDAAVMEWGRRHNLASLDPGQRKRVRLLRGDVRSVQTDTADIIIAMNFSYYLFKSRTDLGSYFANARRGLAQDGILFLDAYGGYEAAKVIEEPRECGDFTYIWEQASFNPIDSLMNCRIHFEFADGSRLERAFEYHWRLWTLPEIRELLSEVGFSRVDVYWEGTDPETNEGDGVYTPSLVGDADPGWVCYVVAQP